MNEVTRVHLGRQAFTIAVDAHQELKKYLDNIKKHVKDSDVLNEIELRMAELLTERGVTTKKVILKSDVDFLKTQLGNPEDFEEADETAEPQTQPADRKKLFRDTDNAMIAGVAAGLAAYFGVEVLLIRILFVIGVFATAGWGILAYIILWILVPEAKTSSDRLQMAGKPVTVDNLKVLSKADVKGATRRARSTAADLINNFFRVVLKIIGIGFVALGLSMLFGLVASSIYFFLHDYTWSQANIFPVGFREHLLVYLAASVAGLTALFMTLFGVAIFRRKWPIRAWITGVLVGLTFIGVATVSALIADAYPHVRKRYEANVHTTVRTVEPFTAIDTTGSGVNIDYQQADRYYVELKYYGRPDISTIKITVTNDILQIDSRKFDQYRNCQALCIPDTYQMEATVYSPQSEQLLDEEGMLKMVPASELKLENE